MKNYFPIQPKIHWSNECIALGMQYVCNINISVELYVIGDKINLDKIFFFRMGWLSRHVYNFNAETL